MVANTPSQDGSGTIAVDSSGRRCVALSVVMPMVRTSCLAQESKSHEQSVFKQECTKKYETDDQPQ
jgi:hypothetical protein